MKGGNIINNGLLLYFDASRLSSYSGTGSTLTDLAADADGTITGATYSATRGGSLVFNGASNNVEILANNAPLRFANNVPYSISAWCYVPSAAPTGNFYTIFSYAPNPSQFAGGYYFQLDNNALINKSFLFDYTDNAGSYWSLQGIGSNWAANTWFNICGTYTGTGGTTNAKVYVNGSLSGTTSRNNDAVASANYVSNSAKCMVGCRFNQHYFNGEISTVMVYNRALSAAEVNQNYQVTRRRFGV